jgi:hypothetical protein
MEPFLALSPHSWALSGGADSDYNRRLWVVVREDLKGCN